MLNCGKFYNFLLCKTAEIRYIRSPLKRRRCEQFKKRAENLQGAYIDVRDRKLLQRDAEMRRICAVCKTVKMRAVQEARGKLAGSVQVVRDQGKT